MTKEDFIQKWTQFPEIDKDAFTKDLESLFPDDSPDKIATFAVQWASLWPTPEQMVSYGYPDKQALIEPGAIATKMKAMFKDFKKKTGMVYSFQAKCDIITKATKEYINKFKSGKSDWRFIAKAHYFITKDGNSELVSQIMVVKNKPTTINQLRTNSDHKFA